MIFLIPGVQTYTAQKLTKNINETYGTQINIERLKIGLNADIEIQEVMVFDHHNDTIFDVNKLSTSIFNISGLLNKGNLDLSKTEIEGLKMKLIRYKNEDSDNLGVFLQKFETDKPKDSTSTFKLHIDDVFLVDSEFSVIDYNLDKPEAFSIKNLNFDVNNINIVDDKVSININSLSGITGYGLKIDRLQTKFFMNGSQMRLDQLKLKMPESEIATDLKFEFQKGDWSDFENKVQISANFDQSKISTTDLNYFYSGFGFNENLVLSGQLNGTLNDFSFKNIKIDGMQRSEISGDIVISQITNPDKFQLKTQNIDITTNYFDLKRLLPKVLGDNLPEFIQYMGNFSVNGQTQIFGQNLNAELNLKSTVGQGLVKLDFKNLNLPDEVEYKGFLNLKKVNLAKLAQSNDLGLASFNFYINGKGFTEESLNTQVNGKIHTFEYNSYVYKTLSIDGNLKYPIFNGKIDSQDPNFLFDFDGTVNASNTQNIFSFESNIKYADLYQLNFIEKDSISIFKGNFKIDMKANTIDDAVGQIKFNDFNYTTSYDTYKFKDFILSSEIKNNIHYITVNSPDVIDGRIYGHFEPSKLPHFIDISFRNLYFKDVIKNQFTNKNVNFEFKINNKIVEAIFPEISIAPQTFLNGKISSNEDEMKLRFISPQIRYKENILKDVEIQIDKQNPFFDTYIEIADIQNATYPISNLNLINVKLNDTLFFRTEFSGGANKDDKFNLSLYQTYDKDNNTVVGFQNSNILFKNNTWEINKNNNYKNNRVILESGLQKFIFDSLAFSYQNQVVKLNGEMRDSTYKDINLKLETVELNNITPYIDSVKLGGLVNANMRIYQKNGQYAPNLNVMVRDFEVNDLQYGDLKLSANGNENLSDFDLKAYLTKAQQNFLSAEGQITTNQQEQLIDLDISFDDLDISSLSPLGSDVISRIRGKINGNAKLFGSLSNPDFSGQLLLDDAGLKFPYLNIDFDFQNKAKIILDKKKFVLDDILLTDTKYKTQGTLSGFISHDQFKDWNLNLDLTSDNILTLDTPYTEESLYYGTAFISGKASISGPTDALTINVNATSQPNTVFNIPLSDTETIGDNSFIYFLTPEDKQKKAQGKDYLLEKVSGLSLKFDLIITNDALVEVVVDQESGSTLRGRGDGNLLIEINTNGKFDMYGDFVALSGEYIYKYQGLIEKKFEVIPGGYLSWEGNPVDANMDIQAKYTTNANPAVLLDNPSVNREIPIDVIITLNGELMQPDISFDIQYPNLSSTVESELNYRIQGRENTEKQALSLVVQGTFYNNEGVGMNAIGSNLLAERATSIIDQILKDDEGKFNIGFDYIQAEKTPNQNAIGSDRVGMTLQTQLSDRIFINGRFGVPVGGQTQSFVFGDVELNFLLNESGSLRAQMFNRESNIQFIGEELGYTQGLGILYTVDFETFEELFRKMLNKKESDDSNKQTPKDKDQTKTKSLVPNYIKFPGEQ
ncbi:translocation/assembly module TamB domain-containing protein [Flavobacterium sp. CS20]|uniref:translocation/assembly module TamB domain-containing protein n=1 Tax=Flavobacterium sp. CS20 TaxID=2775246 RepID=UPI001B3A61E5|nr:translocation/assembly module TamB domain-containing protein [Flavobacterium sp. CS20]QTY27761.1 translocation/assembly module TamB [Flavobacterium sp. CS20]